MPSERRSLDPSTVRAVVATQCWRESGDELLGIELEWLSVFHQNRTEAVPLDVLERVVSDVGRLPNGSTVTIEPGGQLELATAPAPSAGAACTAASIDLALLHHRALRAGVDLVALGIDPARPPQRVVTEPRYSAMQEHFDRSGAAGRTMMCSTASLQVNVGLGRDAEHAPRRWEVANAVGPVLLATFANSPVLETGPTGSKSTRSAYWWGIDSTRTAPVPPHPDPVEAWHRYALAANVMLIRLANDRFVPLVERLSFEQWLTEGHELGWPTVADLEYHLTTLFPPVRLRGWLELRMIDALPAPTWQVASHVAEAILREPAATEAAARAVSGTEELWAAAGRHGLDHPELASAADRLFSVAVDALDDRADPGYHAAVVDHRDRYVRRRRCPADDVLDAYATGSGARMFDLYQLSVSG